MFRFIHAADIHLDSPLRGLETYPDAPVEQIRGATRRAFDNLITLALDEKVSFILLAGDLYDGDWKDYNTGIYFIHRMGRLREAGIRVFMVAGNHDAASQLTRSLQLPDNVTLFSHKSPESRVLSDLGVAIHGQSFAGRAVSEDLSQAYPRPDPDLFHIGLLHTSLTGRPGHAPYAPCTLESLKAKGYDYWALGHVHQHEVVAKDPWIVFPGNIQGRHVRETGPKGCTLVAVDSGRIVAVEHRDLDVLRFSLLRVDLGGCQELPEALLQVREGMERELDQAQGRPLAVRVMLAGSTSLHTFLHSETERLHEEVRALAATLGEVWLEKLVLDTHDSGLSIPDDDSPLAGLARSLAELDLGEEALSGFPGWTDVLAKLPPEIRDSLDQDDAANLRDDVHALLLTRLKGGFRED